jgi:hypothetical protein
MTDRERLLKILNVPIHPHENVDPLEAVADFLLDNGVTFQTWIPVTERLPDWKDGKVLVFTKYGFSICERTVNGRWKGQHAKWITHWKPLPEPPQEE